MAQQINFVITMPLPSEALASVAQHERFIMALKQFLTQLEPGADAAMSLIVTDAEAPKRRRHRRTRAQLQLATTSNNAA